jgi:hypothetical protein
MKGRLFAVGSLRKNAFRFERSIWVTSLGKIKEKQQVSPRLRDR